MTQVVIRIFLVAFLGAGSALERGLAQEAHLRLAFRGDDVLEQTADFSANVEMFVDSTGRRDLAAVRAARFSPLASAPDWGEVNLHNCQHNYWLRFRGTGRADAPGETGSAFLNFGNHHFAALFFSKNGHEWQQRAGGMAHHRTTGQNEYLALPPLAQDTLLFYARLADRPRPTFTLRAQLDSQRSLKAREALALLKNKYSIYPSLAVMAIWVFMALFSLLQFGQNRERSYLHYAFYVLSLAFGLLKTQEYQWRLPVFFSYFPVGFVYSEAIAAVLPHIAYRLFVAEITDLKKHLPSIARLFTWTIWFLLGYLALDCLLEIFFFREAYCIPVYLAVRVALGLVSVYCIVRMFSIRTQVARLVVWGTVVLYAGVLFGLFKALTSGFNFQGEKVNIIVAACTVEILIFSMALGRKSKIVAEERNRLEKDLLEAHTRIARDLHDDLGSALSSIALNSQLAATATPEKMREALVRTSEEARQMTLNVRDLMWSLQPDSDSMASIASRMRQFAMPILEAQNIDYQFEIDKKALDVQLDVAARRHFYFFFKEAVNNLAKYASATKAHLALRRSPDGKMLSLEVRDNGVGFDPNTVRQGHGLANLAARAALLRGSAAIESAPRNGTRILLTFPI
jgi:signal transduction histidine kinase